MRPASAGAREGYAEIGMAAAVRELAAAIRELTQAVSERKKQKKA